MFKEFKAFAMRGNVIDLAVGIIIGAAFGKIVNSLVSDIIMPLINPAIPGGNWKTIEIGSGIKIGSFLGTTLDFIIIAFTIFIMVKAINALKKKEEAKPSGPAELPPDIKLLAEIRDLLKSRPTGSEKV
jgi:large conductance mechanosensitive channel